MEFTEQEFDIIVEALQHLPQKSDEGFLVATMMMGAFTKSQSEFDEVMEKQKEEFEKRKIEKLDKEIACKQVLQRFLKMKQSIVVPN